MPASVICISRIEGSSEPEIGRLVAERVGFRHVDEGIIMAAAQAEHLLPESVALAESRNPGRQIEVDFNRFEQTETVRELIRNAIVATADEGNVVIVAHAASFALAGRDDVLRVLLTASHEIRVSRCADAEGTDEKAAAKQLKDSDKNREVYLKRFYSVSRELPTHFDLVLNTDKLTSETTIETIAQAAAQ